jgi:hypothetical protein
MKKLFTLNLLILALSFSIAAQDIKVEEARNKAVISFETLVYEYGEIEYEGNGECSFEFTNTGTESLVLSNVQASCGCTVPKWSKDPIKPGEKGTITVKYNTRIPGNFNKSIRVYSNADPSQVVLRIKGSVKQKEQTGQK